MLSECYTGDDSAPADMSDRLGGENSYLFCEKAAGPRAELQWELIFVGMGSPTAKIWLAALALGVVACVQKPAPPPATPSPQKVSSTKAEKKQRAKEQPKLIAPPPAYGNKIVLARGSQAPTTL